MKETKDKKKNYAISVDKETYERLTEYCKERGIIRNWLVSQIINKELNNGKKD